MKQVIIYSIVMWCGSKQGEDYGRALGRKATRATARRTALFAEMAARQCGQANQPAPQGKKDSRFRKGRSFNHMRLSERICGKKHDNGDTTGPITHGGYSLDRPLQLQLCFHLFPDSTIHNNRPHLS